MTKRRGYAAKLYVNTGTEQSPVWTLVAGQKSADLSRSTETVDDNTKDNPTWDEKAHGRISWSVSMDGAVTADDNGYDELENAWMNREFVTVRLREITGEETFGKELEGKAIITDLSESEPDGGEASTYSVTLEGTGELKDVSA